MKIDKGLIIILSYPDTVVRPAYTEFSSKIWPKIGIGSKHAVQAGHSALLLIKENEPEIKYFDFGRYITTFGYGRVRSSETDPELIISIKAIFKNNQLINLKSILLWIEKHPEKTHGEGRLVASINDKIDYNKALLFINSLIDKKEIHYGAFIKNGTNCARFVTDTLINSCFNKKIKLKLKSSYLLTPSPIGNTIKGNTTNKIFQVEKGIIKNYDNNSILKEYLGSFFNKYDNKPNLVGTEKPNLDKFSLKKGTWLSGIGSGAWFAIEKQVDEKTYQIARYTSDGLKDFEHLFQLKNNVININNDYHFIHPTNCKEVFLKQKDKTIVLEKI